jgi:hypothetical protein
MSAVFFSDNDTNTPADALKAIGLAEVLHAWLEKLERDDLSVTITDRGGYYEIRLPSPLEREDIEQIHGPFAVGRGKKLGKKSAEKKSAQADAMTRTIEGFVFDYDEQRAKADNYFQQYRKLSQADQRSFRSHPEEFPDIQPPDPDLSLYGCLNHFKVADAYNTLCQQWQAQDKAAFQANLLLVLETFARSPNGAPPAQRQGQQVTLLQVVNPVSGKGGNSSKASALGIGNLKGFWLTEYLKFVGFFTIAAPLMVQKSKDRKTYVLRPVTIELSALRDVMQSFRASFYSSTAVKMDILAALQFTRELVQYIKRHLEAREKTDSMLALFRGQPRVTDIGRGFDITFYKDMGSAYATMNLATINLPGWLGPISLASAQQTLDALSEHMLVVRSIRTAKEDEGSEELDLLRRYRDFLSGHDPERFFDFAAHYGDYYLAKRMRNQRVAQFTTEGIKTLMAQTREHLKFSLILENEGFKAIAAAIRQATVIAQRRAASGEGYPFEVRYGLGQQLLRAATYPEEFIGALSEFLHAYNAENARIAERVAKRTLPNISRNRRAAIQIEHIKQIVRLIDEYESSELICKMLVAYGYARDPYLPEDKAATPAEEDLIEDSPAVQEEL